MSTPLPDLDVLQPAIASGDTRAFGAWLAMGEPVLRRALGSFASRVDVESVLQEGLLRLWQVAPRFESDGHPNGLLRLALRITRNLAISETRRLGSVVESSDRVDDETKHVPEEDPRPDPFLRSAIVECTDKLPASPKKALLARCESAGGDTDTTLASLLGMRLNTFLQNFTRARKLLAECLAGRGVELPGSMGA